MNSSMTVALGSNVAALGSGVGVLAAGVVIGVVVAASGMEVVRLTRIGLGRGLSCKNCGVWRTK